MHLVLFCLAKKATRKRDTSSFREGTSIELCATVFNSGCSLMVS